MLWERKLQLEREMQAAIDPEAGNDVVEAMKKEIHRMRVRGLPFPCSYLDTHPSLKPSNLPPYSASRPLSNKVLPTHPPSSLPLLSNPLLTSPLPLPQIPSIYYTALPPLNSLIT